jgi:hypothetical protein
MQNGCCFDLLNNLIGTQQNILFFINLQICSPRKALLHFQEAGHGQL